MKTKWMWLVVLLLTASSWAQVLTTGETLGKGGQSIMISENRLFIDGIQINIAYLQYARGLTKRFDLYAGVGDTGLFNQHQNWVCAGGNLHLFHVEKFNVSFFNMFSAPIQRRQESSTVLLNSAIVVSRNVRKNVTVYSGFNTLFPIGARDRGFFTPTEKKFNVPIGASFSKGKWTIFLEGDVGHLKAVGIGLARSF